MVFLLVKITLSIAMLFLGTYIFPGISYPYFFQPVILGLIIALTGRLMEYMVLEKGFLWTSTLMDLISFTAIIHIGSLFMEDATITFVGAFLTALLLSVGEHLLHYWIVRTGRSQTANG